MREFIFRVPYRWDVECERILSSCRIVVIGKNSTEAMEDLRMVMLNSETFILGSDSITFMTYDDTEIKFPLRVTKGVPKRYQNRFFQCYFSGDDKICLEHNSEESEPQ
jgi:hypothetical protein